MTSTPREPLRLVVGTEVFEVAGATGQPGGFHYSWTSGPNPGYGFTSVPVAGYQLSIGEHEEGIRDFLESINPGTGYLD